MAPFRIRRGGNRAGGSRVRRNGEDVAWAPLHSTVAGHLPLAELPEAAGYSMAYFEVDVETPGPVVLTVESPDGKAEDVAEEIMAWVDGQPAALAEGRIEFFGKAGRRRITLAVDRAQHAEGALRVKLLAPPGSAEASVVKEW